MPYSTGLSVLTTMDHKDDKENGSINDVPVDTEVAETARVVDRIAERQLCRKFDVRLMPVLAIMCKSAIGLDTVN